MLNFWTKKKKEELNQLDSNWKVMNVYNNATPEQKNQIRQIAQNTANQNFTAEEYNKQARENWEADWNNAYRRDILWINDTPVETEAEKKRRLMSEYYKNRNDEYEKRKKENPETALPSYMETQQEQENQQKEQVQNLAETQKEQTEQVETPNQKETNPTNIPSTDTAQIANGQLQAQNQWQSEKVAETNSNNQVNTNATNQTVDYNNWNVDWWKSRWSNKAELEEAIEKKYGTVATWWDDWTLTATINWEKFQWKIDQNGNPIKTSLWKANQGEITRNQVFQMVQNGNTTDEINDYIYKNNLQDDPQVKNQLKQKYIDDYEKPILQKYKNLSLEDLHKAVLNGEILPWTEVFNKLPQAQAYNQYQKSFAIIDARKDKDFSLINSSIDIEDIIDKRISKFFDTKWIDEIAERRRNDPEIKQYRSDIYESQKKIKELEWKKKNIEREVRKRMWWAPESMVQAEIAWQAESLLNSISTETAMMNASLGMIWDKKQDFEIEMKMLWYKDWLKKEQYMVALWEYKYERWRMDEFKKLEMQYKNQELAFNRQQKAQKEMYELQQKYKWGTYQVGVDWSLNYIVDWKAQKVQFDDWKTLFTNSRQDITVSTKLNDDWTFSVYSVSKDWKNVYIQNYDMEWNLVAWMPNKVAEALVKVWFDGKQCAEWVNDYLNLLWVKGRYVPSDWEGKKSLINSEGPVIGWLAIWNPAQIWSENYKYWHVWIIESVSQDWQYVYISDWNADWVSEKFTRNRKVAISDIMKTWWFNRPPLNIKKWDGDFNSIVWNTDLRNSEWKNKYPNEASFKNNNTGWITWNSNFENPKPGTTAYILRQNGINFHKWTARSSGEWWYYVAFDNVEDWIKAHYLMLKNSTQTVRDRLKSWVWIWNVDAYAKEVFAGSWLDLSLLDKPLNTLSDRELTPLLKSQIKRENSWMYRYLEQNNWLQNYQAVNTWNSKWKTTSSSTSWWNSSESSNWDYSWYSLTAQRYIKAIQDWTITKEQALKELWSSKDWNFLSGEILDWLWQDTEENRKMKERDLNEITETLKIVDELIKHPWRIWMTWAWFLGTSIWFGNWWTFWLPTNALWYALPWSDSKDFKEKVKALNNRLFLSNIQSMRWLWSMTEKEWNRVSWKYGDLEAFWQSEEQYLQMLKNIKNELEKLSWKWVSNVNLNWVTLK